MGLKEFKKSESRLYELLENNEITFKKFLELREKSAKRHKIKDPWFT